MTYRIFFYGRRLLSAPSISIDFVLPFIFNSWGWGWGALVLHEDSPRSRRIIRGRSYIPDTSLVGWALLDR
jgi:hypothetical protein